MAEDSTRLRIDPREIPDVTLARFRKLVVTKVLPLAPRFAEWLVSWCSAEEYHRRRDPKHRHVKHLLGLPLWGRWSNSEIGQALRAITILSLIPMHGSLDDLLDRLTLAISEEAADRLETL